MRLGGFDGLHVADVVPGRPVRCLGAVLGTVDLPYLERIYAELAGQLVNTAFDPKRADRCAGRPVCGDLRAVAEHVVTDRFRVRQVIDREPADTALLNRRALKRARLVFEHGFRGSDPPVLFGAELDFDDGTRGRPGRPEHLLPAHHDLYRAARLFREHVGDRLEIDDRLAAKAAADLGGDRTDARIVLGAGDARSIGPDHELALAGAPNRGLTVRCHRDDTGMRLDISLVHRLCRVTPLDDNVGFGKPGLDVAFGKANHF